VYLLYSLGNVLINNRGDNNDNYRGGTLYVLVEVKTVSIEFEGDNMAISTYL